MKKSVISLLAILMVLSTLLAACGSGNAQNSGEPRTLRIGILGGDDTNSYVREQYPYDYEMSRQGKVKVEIVPAINYNNEEVESNDFLTEQYNKTVGLLDSDNPIDVLLLEWGDLDMIQKLARDNKVKQLDPLIAEQKFDIDDFNPTVLDAIKAAGDNNLYALAANYRSNALFFNTQIFTDRGIEPPHDGMTWQEIFDLARQVSYGDGDDRVYGFGGSRWMESLAAWTMDTMGKQLQLRTTDPTGKTMTVNTPQWQELFESVYALQQEDVVPPLATGIDAFTGPDQFAQGKVAMLIADYYYVSELQAQAQTNDGSAPLEWDVVSVPQSPNAPDVGLDFQLEGLVAINAKATNTEDAWDYISFLNGKEWATAKLRSSQSLTSRLSVQAEQQSNFNIDAFSLLKPLPATGVDALSQSIPGYMPAQLVGEEILAKVGTGDMTVPEALAEWETEGNRLLGLSAEEAETWTTEYYKKAGYMVGEDGSIGSSLTAGDASEAPAQ
jgi:multiple sugar transport system substrate-binding protein